MKKLHLSVVDHYHKHWLLVGILLCIFLAGLYPDFGAKDGPLKTDYTVKYGAVFVIFLTSGLSLKSDKILYACQQYKLHLFIQLFTFIFIPIYTQIFIKIIVRFGINSWILKGLITAACMPPPVSSAVILTRAANGNETVAIFNSILGNFIGIIITPLSLFLNLGSTTVIPLLATIIQLTTTVLIPLMLGQIIKNFASIRGRILPLNTIGQSALLFVIYTTFCDTFQSSTETGINALDIILTVISILFMQISLLILTYYLSQYLMINLLKIEDIIAIMFCSTHKSLTLGIPILKIMFHGYSHLSQISLPLLIYHPTQIILGGLMVLQLKELVQLRNRRSLV